MIKLDTSTAGLEYGVYLDNSKISWNSEGEFKGLTAGKEYKFVTRVKFDEKEQMEGPISDVLKVTTKRQLQQLLKLLYALEERRTALHSEL